MIQQKSDFKISSPQDIDTFKNSIGKTDSVHLDLKDSKLEKNQFIEIFDKLAETKKKEFHLDLANTLMEDDKIDAFVKCFNSWDSLKNLRINFSNMKFSETQFSKILDSVQNLKNLEKLQMNLKNVNLNRKMRTRLESLFENLPGVKELAINTKSSTVTEEDVRKINDIIRSFPRYVHWHDFPSLYPSHFCSWHSHDDWPMLL